MDADPPGVALTPPAPAVFDDDEPAADAASFETRRDIVGRDLHAQRLDRALVALAPEFSRNHLQSLIERGRVRVDGKLADVSSRRLRIGQQIEVELVPTEESLAFRPQAMSLQVMHEDEHLLVLNKPAGLVVHPAPGHWSGTLLNGLLAHHPASASLPRAGIVHRLDKDTSGVMMVGKTLPAVTALVREIAARSVRRNYLALVHGHVTPPDQQIDAAIGRDPAVRVRMAVVAGGKPARTDVQLVAHGLACSAVQCTLHTGRTHQIRVHLTHRGHPLVGDAVYGGKPALGLSRHGLHAARLELSHPVTHQRLVFQAIAPDDFETAWQAVCGRPARWRADE